MNGIQHIQQAFDSARQANRSALILYYSLGYPDIPTSLGVVQALAQAGADIIELGVPFSDPLADGPTIQHSTQIALEQGVSVPVCLELTRQLRAAGIPTPLLLMGYINPLLAYGLQRFVLDARSAGADGLIVPDLPPEEAQELHSTCAQQGLALVYLLSPSSPPERIAHVAAQSSGFLYLVSLTGVTGARASLPPDLPTFVARARQSALTPLAVGFGISTPAQAAAVGGLADGVIVGSALINAVGAACSAGQDPVRAAREFTDSLRTALNTDR